MNFLPIGIDLEYKETNLLRLVVCIGWNEMPDLSAIKSFEEIKELYSKVALELSPKVISNFSGQLWAFVGRIQVGDLVALPLKTRSAIAVGKITGDYQYSPEYREWGFVF